jgi:hypothetical protein
VSSPRIGWLPGVLDFGQAGGVPARLAVQQPLTVGDLQAQTAGSTWRSVGWLIGLESSRVLS